MAAPGRVEAKGAWANYDLGPGGVALPSGRYVACLCADVDGPDGDQVACNAAEEFNVAVARLQVAAVQGPQLYSSISGTITLRP